MSILFKYETFSIAFWRKKKSLFDIIKEKGKRELHLGAKKTETPA